MPTFGMDPLTLHPFLVRRGPDAARERIPELRGSRTTEGKPKMHVPELGVKGCRRLWTSSRALRPRLGGAM
jgi:hypothetical protein